MATRKQATLKRPDIAWDRAGEFYACADNPTPPNADIGYLMARDGKALRNGVFWVDKPARGTIVLMTGYAEFIEKYFETIMDLQAMGYVVVLPEWRGHGLSEGNSRVPDRLHLDDFDQNIDDLEDRFERLIHAHCPPPYFALAHSMGGQIGLRAAHRHPDWFAALSLSAPMLGIRLPVVVDVARRLFSPLMEAVRGGDIWNPLTPLRRSPNHTAQNPPLNLVTSDAARFARNEALCREEPRLQINGFSLGWSRTAFATMRKSRDTSWLHCLTVPLFIGTAGLERLVDNEAHAHVLANVPDGHGKLYPAAMHEIMMEKDALRQAFLADVDAFCQMVLARAEEAAEATH